MVGSQCLKCEILYFLIISCLAEHLTLDLNYWCKMFEVGFKCSKLDSNVQSCNKIIF